MSQDALRRRPLDDAVTLSLVIPVFDEDETLLDELVRRLGAVLGTLPCPAQIVLVDDGSDERTPRIVVVPGAHGYEMAPKDHASALPSIDVVSRALVRWSQLFAD